MELTWSRQMSVGNETIDSEHKKIFGLVEELDRVIRTKDSALFSRALKLFEDTTRLHFKHEENIARAIGFHFEEHNLEHRYILDEIQLIKAELGGSQSRWSESVAEHYFQFLSKWAMEHVIEDDMKMKPLLETYPYDFRPEDMES